MQTNAKTARPGAERKRPDRKPKKQAPARKAGPQTAQQTIPYREIFKDGICRVNDRLYTKSMEYEDINYQLAQADDQSAILNNKTFYIVVAEKTTVFNYVLPLFNNLSSELIPSFGFGPYIFNFP